MPDHRTPSRTDLHVYLNDVTHALEFGVAVDLRRVIVRIPVGAMADAFGPSSDRHDLLRAYEDHREAIDAAVVRCAVHADDGLVEMVPEDLAEAHEHD